MGEVMRAIPAQNGNNKLIDTPPSDSVLLHAVDRVPETRGMGVVIISRGTSRCVRKAKPGDSTIVFEYRRSPLIKPQLADTKPRNNTISPVREWLSAGLNCGVAALAWIGVVGAGAAEPVTGGADTFATVFLWAGAMSASGQCSASVTRVTALETGHASLVKKMDKSPLYGKIMIGLDVVGIVSVGGAIKDIVKTRDALKAAGIEWDRAMAANISRQQRRTITELLALKGGKRVAAQSISLVVKKRLLDAVAAGLTISTSASIGSTHDLIIWILTPSQEQ